MDVNEHMFYILALMNIFIFVGCAQGYDAHFNKVLYPQENNVVFGPNQQASHITYSVLPISHCSVPIHCLSKTIEDIACKPICRHEKKKYEFWTIKDWEQYFTVADHFNSCRISPYELNGDCQLQLCNLYRYYSNSSFRDFIKNMPVYHEAICKSYSRMKQNKAFAKALSKIKVSKKCTLKDFIESLTVQWQQHKLLVRTRMADQKEKIALLSDTQDFLSYGIDKTSADQRMNWRLQACKDVAGNEAIKYKRYTVSPAVVDCMKSYGNDIESLSTCLGVPLQQVLHREYLAVARRITELTTYASCNEYVDEITHIVSDSMRAGLSFNHAGYLVQSWILADCSHALLDYGEAIVRGVEDGIFNTVQAILHPIETISNIIQCAGTAAYYVGQVLTQVCDISGTYIVDADLALEKYLACTQVVEAVAKELYELYESTPGPELVRFGVSCATEAVLAHQCGKSMYRLYHRGQSQCAKLLKKLHENPAMYDAIALSPEGIQTRMLLNASPQMFKSGVVGEVLIGNTPVSLHSAEKLCTQPVNWSQLAFSKEIEGVAFIKKHEKFLKRLPVLQESGLRTAPRLKEHPYVKFSECIQKYFATGDKGYLIIARGAMYELETAAYLHEQENVVVGFSLKLAKKNGPSREFDIVTNLCLVECKNWDWKKFIGNSDKQSTFVDQQLIANSLNKNFKIYSRTVIPAEWKQWFKGKGIMFCEFLS